MAKGPSLSVGRGDLHDMGVEIQGIQWAIRELEKAR